MKTLALTPKIFKDFSVLHHGKAILKLVDVKGRIVRVKRTQCRHYCYKVGKSGWKRSTLRIISNLGLFLPTKETLVSLYAVIGSPAVRASISAFKRVNNKAILSHRARLEARYNGIRQALNMVSSLLLTNEA